MPAEKRSRTIAVLLAPAGLALLIALVVWFFLQPNSGKEDCRSNQSPSQSRKNQDKAAKAGRYQSSPNPGDPPKKKDASNLLVLDSPSGKILIKLNLPVDSDYMKMLSTCVVGKTFENKSLFYPNVGSFAIGRRVTFL